MNLQQLRYVTEIAACGSITEAARRLYLSQPSLSAALRDLERELGIRIFIRSARGASPTADGSEFLSYARQVLEQVDLIERRYKDAEPAKRLCSISTQHYAFAVNAFVQLIRTIDTNEYDLTLRETRTREIFDDVAAFRSELGVIYLSGFNGQVLRRLVRDRELVYEPLFDAVPHVFVSRANPLAGRASVTLSDLDPFPFLCYEQGDENAFYFSEELLPCEPRRKTIHVTDRATLFNLLIGLDGYTICSGVLNRDLNGDDIVSVPLQTDETMQVGVIRSAKVPLGQMAARYLAELKRLIEADGYEVLS